MLRRLLKFFLIIPMSAFAEDSAWIAGIEADALQRAASYSKDVARIEKDMEKARESGQIKVYESELRQSLKTDEPIATHLQKVSQVLVFLSFSMPEKSLHAWLLQCRQSGATPVIRGLVNNSLRDTMVVFQKLAKETDAGVQIDPILFKTFDITQVPAVVHVKAVPSCPRGMDCKPPEYDRIFGDVTLDYALQKMKEGGSRKENSELDAMILRTRGVHA